MRAMLIFLFIQSSQANEGSVAAGKDIAGAFRMQVAMTYGSCDALRVVVGKEKNEVAAVFGEMTSIPEQPGRNQSDLSEFVAKISLHQSPENGRKVSPFDASSEIRLLGSGMLRNIWGRSDPSCRMNSYVPGYSFSDPRHSATLKNEGRELEIDFIPMGTSDCSAAVNSALARSGWSPIPTSQLWKRYQGFRQDNNADTGWMATEWVQGGCFDIVDYQTEGCQEGDILLGRPKGGIGHTSIVESCGRDPLGLEALKKSPVNNCNSPNYSSWTMQVAHVSSNVRSGYIAPASIWSAGYDAQRGGLSRALFLPAWKAACLKANQGVEFSEKSNGQFKMLRHKGTDECRLRTQDKKSDLRVIYKDEERKRNSCFRNCTIPIRSETRSGYQSAQPGKVQR